MPQLNVPLSAPPAQAGQITDEWTIRAGQKETGISAAVVPFGVLCEMVLATGLIRPVSDTNANWPPGNGTNTTTRLFGISIFDDMGVEQGYPPGANGSSTAGWPIGVRIPCLRKGKIWMAFDGNGTKVKFGGFNVWTSSDGTHSQGIATFSAVVTTAGSEILAAPAALNVDDPDSLAGSYTDPFNVSAGVLPVEINLPGYGT